LISLKFTTIKCQEILKATRKSILLPVAEAQASKMLNPIMKLAILRLDSSGFAFDDDYPLPTPPIGGSTTNLNTFDCFPSPPGAIIQTVKCFSTSMSNVQVIHTKRCIQVIFFKSENVNLYSLCSYSSKEK